LISQTPFLWAWRGRVVRHFAAAAVLMIVATAALAADVLFPQPLHITRRIEDSLSQSATTLHEYCAGDQIITVNGDKVSIADYGRQELTEIDRTAGTYSVTRFDELARAIAAVAPQRRSEARLSTENAWKTKALSHDSFEVTNESMTMEIGVDRNVRLSRKALETLIGASFPNPRSETHDAILRTSAVLREGDRRVATNAAAEDVHSLPVKQNVTIDAEGEKVTIRNSVIDVRSELAPPGIATIPPGSRLVEAHAVRLARELRELDRLPSTPADSQ